MSISVFGCGFASMAWPAEGLQVMVIVSAAVSLRGDVVNCGCSDYLSLLQAGLAKMFVSLQYSWADVVPLRSITTLMPGLASLMLLPALITMLFAVTRAISSNAGATTFAARAWN